jgi:hypothetical protein
MGQAPVPPASSNGVLGAFLAPTSFTAVSAGVDNDPADQPGSSINYPGNNNYVKGHTLKYCPNGLSQNPSDPPGTCASSAWTILFSNRVPPYTDTRYLYVSQAVDFNQAEVVSQSPQQNLPAPVCP